MCNCQAFYVNKGFCDCCTSEVKEMSAFLLFFSFGKCLNWQVLSLDFTFFTPLISLIHNCYPPEEFKWYFFRLKRKRYWPHVLLLCADKSTSHSICTSVKRLEVLIGFFKVLTEGYCRLILLF